MKNLLFKTLIIGICIVSCSKDEVLVPPEAIVYPEENPLQGYLTQAGFDLNSSVNFGMPTEFGFKFKPTVKGRITTLIVKTPSFGTGDYEIKFYDPTTSTLISTNVINITGPNIEITKVITPFELEKNKEYVITNISNVVYRRSRTDGAIVTYPIVSGNIAITGVVSKSDFTNTYPSINHFNRYDGDISFKFQQTE